LQAGDILQVTTEVSQPFNIIVEGMDFSYYATYREDTVYYTVNTGNGIINIANSNLNGTGTMGLILTASDIKLGCTISSIIIKGQQTTNPDIVRFFLQDNIGGNAILFAEVPIPAVSAEATTTSFAKQVLWGGVINIQAGFELKASTNQGQTYSIIASGMDWNYLS
jgi:hypothetical protein